MNRISLRSFTLLTDETYVYFCITSVSSLYLTTTVASYFVTLSLHCFMEAIKTSFKYKVLDNLKCLISKDMC